MTDSDKKNEKLATWSSASPTPTIKLQHPQVLLHEVRSFVDNSTIPEQPTEEQLQASGTATMIKYQQYNFAKKNF